MLRKWTVLLGAAVAATLIAVTVLRPADCVLYNYSSSIAVGFYVRTNEPVRIGSIVTVRAVDVAPQEAGRRGFDDAGDRFIKRIAAVGGQRMCSNGRTLTVGDEVVAQLNRRGTETPRAWIGCRVLLRDEILLLGEGADSFDGRYWGPLSAQLIEGVWRKL